MIELVIFLLVILSVVTGYWINWLMQTIRRLQDHLECARADIRELFNKS